MTRIVDDVPCAHAIKRNSEQTVSLLIARSSHNSLGRRARHARRDFMA